ncbi:MAG TPA: hypothetical protein VHZ55_12785 [Bryobacteraceae bacterium]|jgi:hypothetical protein|nr:hypothetical protein [Bryobacteraceae bacterium]
MQHLPTLNEFKRATDNGFRRTGLEQIDKRLGLANASQMTPTQYISALVILVDECRIWTESKIIKFSDGNYTRSYHKRKKAVDSLMAAAMQELKHAAFEQRKQRGGKSNLASLQPGFAHERTEFEGTKRRFPNLPQSIDIDPRSGSFVAAGRTDILTGKIPASGRAQALANIPLANLSAQEFLELSKELQQQFGTDIQPGCTLPRVHYVRKQERINDHMLISLPSPPDANGTRRNCLYKETSCNPYTSSGEGVKDRQFGPTFDIPGPLDIYVVDRYGNILVAPNDVRRQLPGSVTEYRHSSLSTGKEVICAGRIRIVMGQVEYIDNWSGHYQPKELDLAKAVACLLRAHDLDLKQTKVNVYSLSQGQRRPVLKNVGQLAAQVPASFFANF